MEQTKKSLNNLGQDNSTDEDFFSNEYVNNCKREVFRTPLERVKFLLKERAMKQVDLADKIGMSRQALHNYLRGYWVVPTEIKIKIAQALGIDSCVIWDNGK